MQDASLKTAVPNAEPSPRGTLEIPLKAATPTTGSSCTSVHHLDDIQKIDEENDQLTSSELFINEPEQTSQETGNPSHETCTLVKHLDAILEKEEEENAIPEQDFSNWTPTETSRTEESSPKSPSIASPRAPIFQRSTLFARRRKQAGHFQCKHQFSKLKSSGGKTQQYLEKNKLAVLISEITKHPLFLDAIRNEISSIVQRDLAGIVKDEISDGLKLALPEIRTQVKNEVKALLSHSLDNLFQEDKKIQVEVERLSCVNKDLQKNVQSLKDKHDGVKREIVSLSDAVTSMEGTLRATTDRLISQDDQRSPSPSSSLDNGLASRVDNLHVNWSSRVEPDLSSIKNAGVNRATNSSDDVQVRSMFQDDQKINTSSTSLANGNASNVNNEHTTLGFNGNDYLFKEKRPTNELLSKSVNNEATSLFICDSTLRNMIAGKMASHEEDTVQIICLPDITTSHVFEWADSLPVNRQMQHVTIHIGINDCKVGVVNVSTWDDLLSSLIIKFPNATFYASSILPAKQRDGLNLSITPSNANLKEVCTYKQISYIDHCNVFLAKSGAPKKALYNNTRGNISDISRRGFTQLILNIKRHQRQPSQQQRFFLQYPGRHPGQPPRQYRP